MNPPSPPDPKNPPSPPRPKPRKRRVSLTVDHPHPWTPDPEPAPYENPPTMERDGMTHSRLSPHVHANHERQTQDGADDMGGWTIPGTSVWALVPYTEGGAAAEAAAVEAWTYDLHYEVETAQEQNEEMSGGRGQSGIQGGDRAQPTNAAAPPATAAGNENGRNENQEPDQDQNHFADEHHAQGQQQEEVD